jgi:hypothetical protein
MSLGEGFDDHEANVMAILRVLLAGVAQPDDQHRVEAGRGGGRLAAEPLKELRHGVLRPFVALGTCRF